MTRHLDGEAAAHFAVVDLERPDFDLALRDGHVARAVVAHEDDVVLEIDGVVLGEGAAGAERIHDLHGLRVLDFAFAGDGNSARGEQPGAQDDGADGVFIGGISGPE